MVTAKFGFLKRAGLKAIGLGVFTALVLAVLGYAQVALGVLVGVGLALANIAAMALLLGRLLKGPKRPGSSGLFWGGLFLLKLLVLFGATYYVIAVARLDPIGFAAGYALLLVAIVWQSLTPATSPPQQSHKQDDEIS